MDATSLIVSIFAGVLGTAYFIYGKKQQKLIPLLSGIGLCVVPYFIPNNILLIIACLAMAVMPYFINIEL